MNQQLYCRTLKHFAALAMGAAVLFMLTGAWSANAQPFNLTVTTHLGDKQNFREGDLVSFYVSLDKDAYLTIFYQDAGNQLSVLLPNTLYPQNFFHAGLFIPIPNEQNPFQFRITPPFGKETLWVFASDKPLFNASSDASSDISPLTGSIKSVRNTIHQRCRKRDAQCEEASLGITTTAAKPK